MRFKFSRGSKVEVLNKGPLGSWRCAEIISGNGHTYSVRYNHYLPEMVSAVERVMRKDIRPCPPPMVGSLSWVPGGIVEILEDGCWMPAQVSKVVEEGNYFLVRPFGSSKEFRAQRSNLRLRQSWKDNTWAVIEKDSGEDCNGKVGILSKAEKFKCGKFQPCVEVKRCTGNDQFLNENDYCFEEPYQVFSREKKRRKQLSSHNVEAYTGPRRKIETDREVGTRQRLIAGHSFQPPEKVDAVASPQVMFGEKYVHGSLKNGISQFPELGTHWGRPNDDVVHFTVGSLDSTDSGSLSSSVGSSSPSCSPYRSRMHLKTCPTQDLSIHSEDAEVLCGLGREPSPTKDRSRSEIHQLELNAYHSTLAALYASGPLNWEQEALLTNLRLMLHITNDEHLLELKHLAKFQM